MGISITSPSQIPVNVVEIGNEISQNAINAISASATPSTGNPFQTSTALWAWANANMYPVINNKVMAPSNSWTHPFAMAGNFVLVYRPDTNLWWPWNTNGTQIHSVSGNTFQASFNYDFTDWNGNSVYLSGNAYVGTSNTVYLTLGQWESVNQTTYTTSSSNSYYPATGPSYAGNWYDPIASASFYDGTSWQYRYVFLDGSGGFYTADNPNNPPY